MIAKPDVIEPFVFSWQESFVRHVVVEERNTVIFPETGSELDVESRQYTITEPTIAMLIAISPIIIVQRAGMNGCAQATGDKQGLGEIVSPRIESLT